MDDTKLPTDPYSQTQDRLSNHPESSSAGGKVIDLVTLLGHSQTWIVKTIRLEGRDTTFVQRIDAEGGMRLVLPPEVTAAYRQQADRLDTIGRLRAARKGAATRKAKKGGAL
jgi:hypothetical protein